jgi:phosphate transport system ATP-binding protein
MVFQIPNPLPMSIYRNLALPLRMAGVRKEVIEERVEKVLKQAALWSEVKDRLRDDARNLSGGQQQRLCIARAMILEPAILLLDEPTSSLDEKAAREIELLLLNLKQQCTLLMVSHDQAQVRRVADEVVELVAGRMLS